MTRNSRTDRNDAHQTQADADLASSSLLTTPFAHSAQETLDTLATSPHGLDQSEVESRQKKYGLNRLPEQKQAGLLQIFAHQFANPLIYILFAATVFSIAIQEWTDAGFIFGVLLVNAIIGTAQEFSAQKAATALKQLVSAQCRVVREGDSFEVDAEQLVPGDIVLLESGDNIPADIRLTSCNNLEIDESLLTGESVAVNKNPDAVLSTGTLLADRENMAFAGTLVNRGRGSGVVVKTALNTELGAIASEVLNRPETKAPLLIRMEKFTKRVAMLVAAAAVLMAAIALSRGMPLADIFMLAVALAVSAIPEGLPVALTVALAIGMQKMAKRHVIVRKLVAVEALGSCTYVATDKTGTLTENQLTIKCIQLPGYEQPLQVTGPSLEPSGEVLSADNTPLAATDTQLQSFCQTGVLANEAFLDRRDDEWVNQGDAVDVALLVMAHKAGFTRAEMLNQLPELDTIPYESELKFSASLNQTANGTRAHVKGALETLLPMCNSASGPQGPAALDVDAVNRAAEDLARQGYKVLALAAGDITLQQGDAFSKEHLTDLTFVGLIGMIDPLRPEAKDAVNACREAGVEVAMVTGDHPLTAYAIARDLELVESQEQVVTGAQLKNVQEQHQFDALTRDARVFARVEPHQKLEIVQSLQRNQHFVAVSGDGANDAPALRAAEVGVAMGKAGTDVARESAELIITDDNFSSIVAGIEEGRVAYANVRKVIFLLISTGAAEIVLFSLSLLSGLPLPLLAVQLLWLNLVTNGIQDVALAFEPAEGNELKKPPRHPKEPIFNSLMLQRVFISAITMGTVAFLLFQSLIGLGFSDVEARNSTLLLMVLFENVHVFNSRSETLSAFKHNPLRNKLLLGGTVLAQLIHIGAMYTPWISDALQISPVSFTQWLELLGIAFVVLAVMELHKLVYNRFSKQEKHR